ncbi:MAG TPA: hypothetical protein VM324_16190 [Egibacteraceae bacterium]|nr:hypothetical protein [Egibacteraceae bacterium]
MNMRVLGLAVANGKLFYGVVESNSAEDGRAVEEAPTDLAPSEGGTDSARLAEFQSRYRQDLRSVAPTAVGLVATRRYANWQYRHAFDRISLVAAVMLACELEQMPFREIKTEDIARAVKLPAYQLETLAPSAAGLTGTPVGWRAGRAAAFACALTLLEETAEREAS